ncbi:hypothetical protein DACRYDRAFT_70366 [Dacryopinax primogenitus]|uniref:Autophagy-related protein 4 n=1 Tax=Dacryopinax primogenitus (strain DJM 731) TaxID=1858805 RepID=M5FT25_DACPD|nr:uncharacterized protein DACRYDRAFT_70366 [Dacryopinax primogenitus]EJT99143.1 hypothetical protein DACRYDRAFT_70366 [Dacryopinax primogenitus]
MSSSSPPPPPSSSSSSHTKLPRFIRPQPGRDRSRSTGTYLDTTVPPVALSPGTPSGNNGNSQTPGAQSRSGAPKKLGRGIGKKRSRLFGRGSDNESKGSTSSDRDTAGPSPPPSSSSPSSSPPMILTTPTSPHSSHPFGHRVRNSFQSTRAPSSFDPGVPAAAAGGVLSSNASIISTSTAFHRLSDIPGRLTGWLGTHFTPPPPNPGQQALSSSPSHPSSGNYGAPSPSPSQPVSANNSAVGNHRHSGFMKGSAAKAPGPIEKAFRYLFDTDANPDRSEMSIWLLGATYPGWANSDVQVPDRSPSQSPVGSQHPMPLPIPSSPQRDQPTLMHASNNSLSSSNSGLYAAPSASSTPPQPPQPAWPPAFYASFSSLIYLTYRSQFKPIPQSQPPLPPPTTIDSVVPISIPTPPSTAPSVPESPNRRWLAWVPGRGDLTSDAGWGCMLRTGQMLLANSLVALHVPPLPPNPVYINNFPAPSLPPSETDRQRFEAYVKILVWFLDDPSIWCPFSVHRLALAGADMGREVGQWFGPSIAAGSIKKLVSAFPACGLGVVVPPDQIIHETAVFTASHTPTLPSSASSLSNTRDREARERANRMKEEWGDRAVLILIGLRLGIEGVTPIYYDSVKALFTFPQTVGIAGGRPSSSYYFVGTQGDHLFYLDPHSTRPAVPLRVPTDGPYDATGQFTLSEMKTFHSDKVRKMHISGLDPSMLCGFIVRNVEEWRDLRARVDALAKSKGGKAPIFTIADAPAAWEMLDSDDMSDVGMESISSDSMSVDHEFDEPEHDEHELTTPTVAQHAKIPSAAEVVLIGHHGEEDETMDAGHLESGPSTAGTEVELDDEWEETPGLKSPTATSSSSGTGERADTPVLVPFPQDPNPSPSANRRASFDALGRDRQRERETAKTLVPPSRTAFPAPPQNAQKRSASKDQAEVGNLAQGHETHRERERLTAISPPTQARQHHQHKHNRRPESSSQSHSQSQGAPPAQQAPLHAPTAPTSIPQKPHPRLPKILDPQPQAEREEFSSPEELTASMEFDTPVRKPSPRQREQPGLGAAARSAQEAQGKGGREELGHAPPEQRMRRSTTSSQWEKIEVN